MHNVQDQQAPINPIGAAVTADDEQWAAGDPAYRAQRDARAPYRAIAWMLIKYRMDHGLTQQQLAERAGTSYSQISRIESGRQKTNLEMLLRIAHALDLKVVLGFEGTTPDETPERQTVAL
ncbi:MAG TPA: helix-turn-helix transcriptional regulator [Chloroflexota bacterium]|jgi:DNA-binding XRE family transcriptional regulator|nr:helix-turn-helix transcriptional regulator [Chloroflexota bacterium]